jgi:Zn-finger nucleic acid-binding protein
MNSMSPFNFESDLFFDRCDSCKGMWLEEGELAKTMGQKEDFPEPERIKSGPKSSRKCPKCIEITMIEVTLSPRSKLILDTCPQCAGVWLDSKELVKIQVTLRELRIEAKKRN